MHPFWGGCWLKTGLKCGPQWVQSFLRTAGSWAGCGAGCPELCLGGGTRPPALSAAKSALLSAHPLREQLLTSAEIASLAFSKWFFQGERQLSAGAEAFGSF